MQSSLGLMQHNLKVAKNSLENLIVRAPISGQLSGMDSEEGELISRGDRIAQIVMVTHSQYCAEFGNRIIRLLDGQVVTEKSVTKQLL